ncbi:MAG TPA: 23S rRNA (adenine(2030)-N(6))-methyltransferase RlmJ [Candidatus Binatia bacterium]|nr:23S rRNA (adenine(2030)-N(6))-methyltransferase RlmJ [Candidatus Binatia bacterium]
MPTPPSRYRADDPLDYSHRFHAGNVGDVWKHCVLAEVLRRAGTPSTYLESHAGEGAYPLGPTGEWTEGIGRLRDIAPTDDAVGRYTALCNQLGDDRRYPGSPLVARAVLGDDTPLLLWERDAGVCERLAGHVPDATITCGDGLAALPDAIAQTERRDGAVVALIDPPYTQKADWTTVPDAMIAAVRASRRACVVLWYPVKSLTRPNAMIARLQAAGVSGTIAELVTTPLEHQRRRLNGSGMLLVRPPTGTLETVAAAAPVLGTHCATFAGVWSLRMQSWTASDS